MENNINTTPVPPVNNNHKKITTMVIGIVIIGLLGLTAYNLKRSPGTSDTNKSELTGQSADGFPTVFYSYVGTIQALDNGTITILAPADKNYLTADQTITVKTDGETAFLKQNKNFDINKVEPGQSGEFYQTTTIQFADLKVGQELTAIDYENVRDKMEFTAKRIEVNVTE